MDLTITQPPSAPSPSQRKARPVMRTLGEVLVTLGVLVLLFVVYQAGWTNVVADRAAAAAGHDLVRTWQDSRQVGGSGRAAEYPAGVKSGQAFAFLYLPRLGHNWREPVVQGVALDDLAKGVGHYPASALPGQVGNFAVAGHRATNGEPFAYLDQIRAGDVAVVETATTYYVYRLDAPFIVAPTAVAVVDPVPSRPGAVPTRPLITLTTCNPRWASYERMIVHGVLVGTRPKSEGPPPSLNRAG